MTQIIIFFLGVFVGMAAIAVLAYARDNNDDK